MRTFLAISLSVLCLAGLGRGQNPVPFVNQPLVPDAVPPGSPAFTLTVNGSMFAAGATVDWNGQPLKTTWVSQGQLKAQVPAANVASPSSASITVTNPGPNVASNVLFFHVMNPQSMIYYEDAPGYPQGAQFVGGQLAVGGPGLTTGDFTGNGRQDLAFPVGIGGATPASDLEVLLGNGDGTFAPPRFQTPLPSANSIVAFAEGDFTGNGRLDLVANAWGGFGSDCTSTIYVYLNNGDGTFSMAPGSPVTVGSCPIGIAVGDFNRDGKLDLAVANAGQNPNQGSVSILLGNGDGTFTAVPGGPATTGLFNPYGIVAGDFNGDGILDLAVNNYGGSVNVLLGDGDGTFQRAPGSPVTASAYIPVGLVTGDFNGDGRLDLAETNWGFNPSTEISPGSAFGMAVRVMLGNGDGTFTVLNGGCCGFNDGGTEPQGLVMGDFNGDGILDLAIPSSEIQGTTQGNFVQILLGNGDGTFSPTDYAVLTNQTPTALATADFNNSGLPDFFQIGNEGGLWSYLQVAPSAWAYPPPDFTITAQNPSFSIQAGQTATDNITVSSQNGFYGPVTVSCSGAPQLATCDMLTPSNPAFAEMMLPLENLLPTLTVVTTAPSVASSSPSPFGPSALWKRWPTMLPATVIGLTFGLLIVLVRRKSAYARVFLLGVALSWFGSWSSCGGSPSSTPPPPKGGTPPGTYTIAVTATSPSGGGLSHSVAITLTVQ